MGRIRIVKEYEQKNKEVLNDFLLNMRIVLLPVSSNHILDTREHAYQAVYDTMRQEAKKNPVKMLRVLNKIKSFRILSWHQQERTVNLEVTYYSREELSRENEASSYVKYCENDEEAIEALTCGIIETKKDIVLLMPCEGEHMPEYQDYLEMAYHTHKPGRANDGAYLRSHAKVSGDVRRSLFLGIYVIQYEMEYRTTYEQEQMLMDAVDETIHRLGLDQPKTAGYDKIVEIYRYITKNVEYDYDYERYTAYHAMIEHKAVCMGCAMLFLLFMRKLNVPVEYITGLALPTEGRHAWNIVKLGMHWYNVDTTWEKYCAGKRIHITQRDYFMKSDRDFKNHVREPEFLTEEFMRTHPMASKSI